MRKNVSILQNTILLTGVNLLLRLLAMVFQIILSKKIGPAGIGLLQLILSVRGLAFTAGSAGVRTCAMYLTAGALGRRQEVREVVRGCFSYGALTSAAAAAALWAGAPVLAKSWIGDPSALPALRVFAAFLPVSCLCGVVSGCLTAAGRIGTLAAADLLRQLCAMASSLLLLSLWTPTEPGRACLAASLGDSFASLGAFFLLLFFYHRPPGPCRPRPQRRRTLRRVIRTAMPIGAADSLRAGINALENLIIPQRLALFGGTADALADYGILHGMVFPLLMFPAVLLFSLAELLVPEFSRCAAGERWPRVRYLVRRGLRTALGFSLTVSLGMFFCGPALGQILYRSRQAGASLRLYALFVPLLYTDAIVDAMCKGLGQQSANARYNLLTSCLDVALLWFLLPRYGLGGYYFSFAVSHSVNFVLSLRRLLSAVRPEAKVSRR